MTIDPSELPDRLRAYGVPVHYRTAQLVQFTGDPMAREWARRWLAWARSGEEPGVGLYLCGPNGVGKTFLATALIRELALVGIRSKFTTVARVVDEYAAGWSDTEAKLAFRRQVQRAPILVLDDVGKEFRSKAGLVETVFDQLMRERWMHHRRTILTSNLIPAQFRVSYGDSLASLLNESTVLVKVDGQDIRKTLRKE